MWKNTLSLAALILSVGVSYRLISGANAGPSVSLGTNPVASQGGLLSSNTQTVFTAPSDQDFVVKTLMTEWNCDVYVNGSVILSQTSYFVPARYWFNAGSHDNPSIASSFLTGNANLVVPAGQTLALYDCRGSRYYLDGIYVQP